jgi:multicomponent K+:H+ antiporter subunit A
LGLGLAFAAGIGLVSWFFSRPFLTSAHGHFDIPLLGDIELASVIIFDLGRLSGRRGHGAADTDRIGKTA